MSLIKNQWIMGLSNIAACAAGGGGVTLPTVNEDNRLDTITKSINAPNDGTLTTITWDLVGDIDTKGGTVTLPAISGAKLSINVKKVTIGGKPMYEVTAPTLQVPASAGATPDVLIQSIIVKLNTKQVAGQTTS